MQTNSYFDNPIDIQPTKFIVEPNLLTTFKTEVRQFQKTVQQPIQNSNNVLYYGAAIGRI